MKKKTGVILSSVAAIAVSASVIAGSTYALFTSESQVDITVKSGTVDVTATINEESLATKRLYDSEYTEGKDRTFGGSVSVEGNALTAANIVAGDGIKFSVDIENVGSVDAQYRTVITSDNGELVNELKISIGENGTAFSGAELCGYWESLTVGESASVEVELELPAESELQNAACKIYVKVEAIQGNAVVYNEVSTEEELVSAIVHGGNIKLTDDLEIGKIVDITSSVFVDLNGYTLNITAVNGRPFNVMAENITVSIKNGDIVIPDSNKASYGVVALRGQNDVAYLKDVIISGNTDEGGIVKTFADNCAITLDNINCTTNYLIVSMQGFDFGSIVVNGGVYTLIDTANNYNYAGFNIWGDGDGAIDNLIGEFNNVTIMSEKRLTCSVEEATVVYNNCNFGNPQNNSYFASAIAAADGSLVTVNGGTYAGSHSIYIFNSGATVVVNGGTFIGNFRLDTPTNNNESTILISENANVEWDTGVCEGKDSDKCNFIDNRTQN